jgi:hypothetical protein
MFLGGDEGAKVSSTSMHPARARILQKVGVCVGVSYCECVYTVCTCSFALLPGTPQTFVSCAWRQLVTREAQCDHAGVMETLLPLVMLDNFPEVGGGFHGGIELRIRRALPTVMVLRAHFHSGPRLSSRTHIHTRTHTRTHTTRRPCRTCT